MCIRDRAYMELVLCNTQSELSALERGIHALRSGVSGSEYARSVGRTQQSVALEIQAAKVYEATTHVVTKVQAQLAWRNLAEIHAAPQWLWTALVQQMIADSWTVATTREKVSAFKDCPFTASWADTDKIAEFLVGGAMKIAEISKMAETVTNANVRNDDDDQFHHWMMEALSSQTPSRLSLIHI